MTCDHNCGPGEHESVTTERAQEVLEKYMEELWDHPNVNGFGIGPLEDSEGLWCGYIGIEIDLIQDQSELSAEDRIPDCLDGVPVNFDVLGRMQLLQDNP